MAQAKTSNIMQNVQKRGHQFNAGKKYGTGFERMLLDKFCHMPILRKTPWFAAFGFLNAACYGLSYMMSEEDYVYYFGYKGEGRYTDLVRSNLGSNTLTNAMWTAPALIVGGLYMHK